MSSKLFPIYFFFCIGFLVALQANTYTVKAGETLYRIAKRHRVTVAQIVTLNRLQGKPLRVGLVLKLPPPLTQRVAPPNPNVHVVAAGETLFAIARKHAMTVADLKFRNKLGETSLRVGQRLDVAGKQLSRWVANRGKVRMVHVEAGETLYSIAQRYDVSVQDLIRANGNIVRNRALRAGISIAIPLKATDTTTTYRPNFHTMKAGETLSSVARKYHLSIAVIKYANPKLEISRLSVGKTLRIPRNNSLSMTQILGGANQRNLTVIDRTLRSDFVVKHKTFPYGTILHLTNPHTAKSSFAKVMGRLQGSTRAVMALSPALAQALGMRGNTSIEIRKVKKGN